MGRVTFWEKRGKIAIESACADVKDLLSPTQAAELGRRLTEWAETSMEVALKQSR